MDKMQIEHKVKGIIAEQVGVDEGEVTLLSKLGEDLGADSLDIVELVMAMEVEFDLYLDDAAWETLTTNQHATVQNVVDFLTEKVK